MRVIFMGTPQFSVPTLQKLIDDANIEVAAVYTRQPTKAKRGQKITNSPIHNLALKHSIEVVTPSSLKNEEGLEKYQSFQADIAVVVAYGLILPKNIIESTKFGSINIHPSLLPKYRGATPIQSTLLNGDDKTAVTIIQMDQGVDSGDILLQQNYDIKDSDDYPILAEKFSEIGAEMVINVIENFKKGGGGAIAQDHDQATLSKKINKTDAEIDFSDKADEVLNKIRAFSGFMTTYFQFKGEKIKIFSAKRALESEIDNNFVNQDNGLILNRDFVLKCQDGYLRPLILQKPGKKPMAIKDFLLGNSVV